MSTLRGHAVLSKLYQGGCSLCGQVRYASREEKRQARTEEVIQFKAPGTQPAERVYVWGHARTGALGVRTYLRPERRRQHAVTEQPRPARLRFIDENHVEVKDVACGYGFTLFAVERNRIQMVLGTGINTDSQLGFHEFPKNTGRVLDYLIEPVPVAIPGIPEGREKNILQLACGRAHSVILTKHGVFSQGNNAYGQCGRPVVEGEIFNKISNIQKIEGLPDNVSKVLCGQDHTLFLTSDGQVFSCGLGADGQTGLETYENVGRPRRLMGDIDGVRITDIASRADCVLAISESGDVFGWGNSEYNQLSMVTQETQVSVPKYLPIKNCGKITQIASGGSSCMVLNEKGEVYVWGFGVLGKGPKVDVLTRPSLLPPPLFGRNELSPDVRVKQIKSGISHFGAVTDAGDLYIWGKGKHGSLGIYKTDVQYFPLKVSIPALIHRVELGVDHTVALCTSYT
ncbi:RCC1-like G exchanging factor-like protein [Mya arenaria]|uniref:RCC1-like G exchanging factor-like protein n=1 Tax=Mya arenaria TaxID=6604 RepID=UPI0022E84E0A|nr:RCC1-like G exchanging factor-like protein [Mya arenaria]XP_052764496.1 RCC1-like G exchanging factor-like protein [Mya arenaria]